MCIRDSCRPQQRATLRKVCGRCQHSRRMQEHGEHEGCATSPDRRRMHENFPEPISTEPQQEERRQIGGLTEAEEGWEVERSCQIEREGRKQDCAVTSARRERAEVLEPHYRGEDRDDGLQKPEVNVRENPD